MHVALLRQSECNTTVASEQHDVTTFRKRYRSALAARNLRRIAGLTILAHALTAAVGVTPAQNSSLGGCEQLTKCGSLLM
jgi:hypothetical protein